MTELKISKINLTTAGLKAFMEKHNLTVVERTLISEVLTRIKRGTTADRKYLLELLENIEDFKRPIRDIISEAVLFTR